MNLLYIILIILFILIVWIIYTINKCIYLTKCIERSKSVVDVFLKKRYDLIPNLVEAVKGYTVFEKGTLEEVTRLRNNFNEKVNEEAGEKLNNHYKDLLAVVEAYPDIKSSKNFMELQENLEKLESELQAARRIYINDITTYNTYVESIPINVIASIFKFKSHPFPKFEIEEINIHF